MNFDPSSYPLLNWAFGGVGIALLGAIGTFLKKFFFPKHERDDNPPHSQNTNEQNVNLNIYNNNLATEKVDDMNSSNEDCIELKKNNTKILFIDDEVRFKVVKILQRAGWLHTKLIKDADSLDQQEIKEAKIIFVDIQGVGIELTFKEEGLGLASALKNKYPEKKIIIYSAEQKGDRFHKALREVDDFLQKDADPYQFQRIVEDFA
ncbi:hypothetical protein [Erwinia aphidicola]|uniref:hypothetical protein n=1 Tax=Erwinia aphidicola TaxID=68334 RepID=UPI003CE8A2AC